MKPYVLTPAAGKRLIGRACVAHPAIGSVLKNGILVIVAGTTNGYVAEEILASLGQGQGFDRRRFFRGLTLPAAPAAAAPRRLPDKTEFPGDVVIVKGRWQRGQTIFDVADLLKEGDVIVKGANAVELPRKRAAILIGDPKAGTTGAALPAVAGRRVQLLLPVGLEKRIQGDLDLIAAKMNTPPAQGPRLLPVPGQVLTEIEAIALLTGATAELVAGGGVDGAEGCVWLLVSGNAEELQAADSLLTTVSSEPPFQL